MELSSDFSFILFSAVIYNTWTNKHEMQRFLKEFDEWQSMGTWTVFPQGKFPFLWSDTGFHSVSEIPFILKALCLAVDCVLTWHPKYNLMKFSVSVVIPDHQMFYKAEVLLLQSLSVALYQRSRVYRKYFECCRIFSHFVER